MKAKSTAGFTLVEMLVVLGIMAVVAAVSLPFVRGSGEAADLESAAQTIAARLRVEQARAVSTNTERILQIDLKQKSLQAPEYRFSGAVDLQIMTAENLLNKNMAAFKFFADGSASGGKIKLTKGALQREININWLTGAVIVSAPTP